MKYYFIVIPIACCSIFFLIQLGIGDDDIRLNAKQDERMQLVKEDTATKKSNCSIDQINPFASNTACNESQLEDIKKEYLSLETEFKNNENRFNNEFLKIISDLNSNKPFAMAAYVEFSLTCHKINMQESNGVGLCNVANLKDYDQRFLAYASNKSIEGDGNASYAIGLWNAKHVIEMYSNAIDADYELSLNSKTSGISSSNQNDNLNALLLNTAYQEILINSKKYLNLASNTNSEAKELLNVIELYEKI